MPLNFLTTKGELDGSDLHECEEWAFKEDTILHRICQRLIIEVRTLGHQLEDPNYMYSGRIHRNAILSRNQQIDALKTKIKELEAKCLVQQEPTPKV